LEGELVKWLGIWLVLVAVVAGIGALGMVMVKRQSAAANKATVVRVEEAQLGKLTETVSAPGQVEPNVNVQISAKTSGRIVELPYDEGATVTRGDPNANPPAPASILVRLDSRDLESRLQSAQADRAARAAQIEVEKARITSQDASLIGQKAALDQAERDYQRQCELLKTKDISQVTCDEAKLKLDDLKAKYESATHSLSAAKLNLKVLEHNLESADAGIEQAKENLSYTIITAPINGTITRINAKVGEMVVTGMMNNPGTKILEVGDLSEMLVVAQVDESDVGKVRCGQAAQVHIQAWPNKVFDGVVRTVALSNNTGNQGSKYYETEVLLKDPNEQIFTGMTADVDIDVAYHEQMLVVPSQAVLGREVDELPVDIRDQLSEEEKGKTYATVVYLYKEGKALVTPVRIGASSTTHTIITSGVAVGDKVVVGPYKELEKLKHKQAIRDEREVKAEEEAKNKSKKARAGDANDANQGK
jgi:HlyD family secretion protein